MTDHWRAFGGSLLLHLLVLGALAQLARSPEAPPRLVYYRVELLPAPPGPAAPRAAPLRRRQNPPAPAPAPKPLPKPAVAGKPSPPTPATPSRPGPPRNTVASVPLPQAAPLPAPPDAPPATGIDAPPQPGAEALHAVAASRYADAQLQVIRDRVSRQVRYPALARRQGWSGQVIVEFAVQPSGEVAGLQILKSCGYPLLDRQALRAVQAAAPFPPPPMVVRLNLPVTFTLD